MPGEKIKVFISSICGEPRYDKVRTELKNAIEGTNLAEVYLSEANPALSLPMEVHDAFALEGSDLCIFLIDNADGVAPEVQKQIDLAKKYGIKEVYYFCDGRSLEQTVLEKNLTGIVGIRKETVHKFQEVSQNGGAALMNDIVSVYRNYCGGNIILKSENEEFQKIGVAGTESVPASTLLKIDNIRIILQLQN
ncbi:MAG: hypothetical protein HFI67_10855 [Lachnospiraceae bacterium]|nr:hypothetical protein [Lachnospiraceae bacterium]